MSILGKLKFDMCEMYIIIFSLKFVPFAVSLFLARDFNSNIHLLTQGRSQYCPLINYNWLNKFYFFYFLSIIFYLSSFFYLCISAAVSMLVKCLFPVLSSFRPSSTLLPNMFLIDQFDYISTLNMNFHYIS